MFDGLMSRWTTPRRDAWTSALAIWSATSTASAGRQRPGGLDPLADGHALDVFEGDVMERPVLADAEDAGDVLVVELGGGAAFLVESLDDFGVDGLVGGSSLSATWRSSWVSRARKTAPIPPTPMASSSRNVPIISPGRGSGIGEARGERPADCRRAELPEPLSTVREWSGSRTSPVDSPLEFGLGRAGGLGGASRLGAQHRLDAQRFGVLPLATHPCQALDRDRDAK